MTPTWLGKGSLWVFLSTRLCSEVDCVWESMQLLTAKGRVSAGWVEKTFDVIASPNKISLLIHETLAGRHNRGNWSATQRFLLFEEYCTISLSVSSFVAGFPCSQCKPCDLPKMHATTDVFFGYVLSETLWCYVCLFVLHLSVWGATFVFVPLFCSFAHLCLGPPAQLFIFLSDKD